MKHNWTAIITSVVSLSIGVGIGRAIVDGSGLIGAVSGAAGGLLIVALGYWRGYSQGSEDRRVSVRAQLDKVRRLP